MSSGLRRPAEGSARRRAAPWQAWVALLLALLLQWQAHVACPAPRARPEALAAAPSLDLARVASFGDATTLARVLMLGLQSYDVQPGVSVPLRALDYARLVSWLRLIVDLHPASQYALLSAARIYAEVPDRGRTRRMLDFIEQAFREDPDRRWPWLAHAVVLARHRLGDPALALHYAHELRTRVRTPDAPHWVGQMEALALADIGQREAARVLLGGLLASGSVTDPQERHFLLERLAALESEGGTPARDAGAFAPGPDPPEQAGHGVAGSVGNSSALSDFRH